MKIATFSNILTVVLLIMAVIQAPFFYYYTFGLMVFFYFIPFIFIALCLTAVCFLILTNSDYKSTRFQKSGLIIAVIIGCVSFLFGEDVIEELDWKLRVQTRQEIVESLRAGASISWDNKFNHVIPLENFPPISNGGNEIAIYRTANNKITVEFFINRGFLDNYSAFIYTDDPEKLAHLEQQVNEDNEDHINKKLAENWYRMSY